MRSLNCILVVNVLGAVAWGCSSDPNNASANASSGGAIGSGGAVTSSVSNPASGGAAMTSTLSASGGAFGSTSSTGLGGIDAIGGNSASGGQSFSSAGGGPSKGGAGNGSTIALGGTGSGPKSNAGSAAGGKSSAMAGGPGTGGAARGGAGSGGKNSGGIANGGAATGGKGTGGAAGATSATGGASGASSSPLPKFIIGADISSVDEAMDRGARYADTDGTTKSIFDILKNHGFNFIRLRAFVKPGAEYGYAYGTGGSCVKTETYCDTAHTVAFAKQVKAAGMGLLLDLHYSDNWADPGNQIIPEDWRGVSSIAQLADTVQSYTEDIVGQLASAGARPDIVQIGNETTPGMLVHVPNSSTDCWGNNVSSAPIGGSTSNWTNLGTLLKAGIAGVKAIDSSIKTMVHIENTKSATGVVNWVKSARSQGAAMDIVGLSCYQAYQGEPSVWKAAFDALASNFSDLSFVIAEYNPKRTEANQLMFDMPNGRGLGTFFWEPTQSGDWGSALFTFSGNNAKANAADFQEFDTIAKTVGLK